MWSSLPSSPFVNAYGGWSPSLQLALEAVKVYYSLSERHGVRLMERRGDLAYPGLEFLLVLEGADVLSSVDVLRLMYRLGVRGVGVTWNLNNKWGHSCYSKGGGGLAEEGYALVEAAQRHGMVVDLAHAGRKMALDVLEAARRPVVISLANVNDVYRHLRNVDGEVIKRLVDNGGVLGLTFIPRTISDSPTLSALVKHAKYVKERYGVEALAVGTDYLGISTTPPGLESVDKIETFFKALREAGFSGEEVEAVAWRNAYRVLREALD